MTQSTAVALYTKPDCQQCTATKRRLTKTGLTFTEVDITADPDAYEYVLDLGHRAAPVVVLSDGRTWSGFRPDLIDTIQEA